MSRGPLIGPILKDDRAPVSQLRPTDRLAQKATFGTVTRFSPVQGLDTRRDACVKELVVIPRYGEDLRCCYPDVFG